MTSITLGSISFACATIGAGIGLGLRERLPQQHLSSESQELVKLATGLIGTMVALVLGLLIASASASFDAESDNLERLGSNLVLLDRDFEQFGPEGNEARAILRRSIAGTIKKLDSSTGVVESLESRQLTAAGRELIAQMRKLVPKTDAQRTIQEQSLGIASDLARTRWNLLEGRSNPIPTPFVVILMTWTVALFICFGLLAPRNATVVTVLFVCALTVAGALALIVELGDPFEGFLQVSTDPLRDALNLLEH